MYGTQNYQNKNINNASKSYIIILLLQPKFQQRNFTFLNNKILRNV